MRSPVIPPSPEEIAWQRKAVPSLLRAQSKGTIGRTIKKMLMAPSPASDYAVALLSTPPGDWPFSNATFSGKSIVNSLAAKNDIHTLGLLKEKGIIQRLPLISSATVFSISTCHALEEWIDNQFPKKAQPHSRPELLSIFFTWQEDEKKIHHSMVDVLWRPEHTSSSVWYSSPYEIAIERNMNHLVEEWIRRGLKMDVPNRSGELPIHIALACGNIEAARLLMAAGASLLAKPHLPKGLNNTSNPTCDDDTDPLVSILSSIHKALMFEKMTPRQVNLLVNCFLDEILPFALKHGMRPFSSTLKGKSPLALHGLARSPRLIKGLLEAGFTLNEKDKSSFLIIAALKLGCPLASLKMLHGAGADLLTRDKSENNALHYALIGRCHHSVLTWLIRKGVNVNEKNADGLTPLMMAVKISSSLAAIKALMNAGADLTTQTPKGEGLVRALIFSVNTDDLKPARLRFLLKAGTPLEDNASGSVLFSAVTETRHKVNEMLSILKDARFEWSDWPQIMASLHLNDGSRPFMESWNAELSLAKITAAPALRRHRM